MAPGASAIRRIVFPLIPQWALQRFLGWQAPPAEATPLPADLPAAKRRLVLGPQDEVGQATQWGRAAERAIPGTVALSVTKGGSDAYEFPTDYVIPNATYYWSRRWQRDFRSYVLRNATHVILESGHRLFGNGVAGGAASEVEQLRRRDIRVAHLFHGSDLRIPAVHRGETPWSPYRDDGWDLADQYAEVSRLNRELVAATGAPVFVSTPDLLAYADAATWLPLVAQPEFFQLPSRRRERRLRVVHAPSSSVIKGSHLVEPVLHRLHEEGIIDYRRVRDQLHSAMPGIYAEADVVLDQFRIGSYGLVAVEAMAAGCAVVGHVTVATREAVASVTGLELPVIEADPVTLEGVLRRMHAGETDVDEAARQARHFALTMHDGDAAANALRPFLEQ